MVAKGMYVDTARAAGSASAASATWPAAGRCWPRTPAWRTVYPLGRGLLAFSTLDEARGRRRVDPWPITAAHAADARALAEEHFDSDRVLSPAGRAGGRLVAADHGDRGRCAGQQAPPRRQPVGAHELG